MWFDGQAEQFDEAAGLIPEAGRKIAQAILVLGGCGEGDLVLDLGAGTGAIGLHFAGLPSRYLGLDLSRSMLQIFRRKLGELPKHMLLVQADSNGPWPIRDGACAVVFTSRVAHQVRCEHFVQEVFRVCRSGGCLLLGQVRREPDSLLSRLQRYKRTLLAEYGFDHPTGGQANRDIADACCLRGATVLPQVTPAQWTRSTTAGRLIAVWEMKPQLHSMMSATVLHNEQRAAIVNRLKDWARREFGGLDRQEEFSEAYTVQAVRLS
jgi:SAM-dependent methyltransferase